METKKLIKNPLALFAAVIILAAGVTVSSCKTASKEEQPKAKNIIFLIGDGMGLQQMHAAWNVNGGTLPVKRVTHVGLQTTQSEDRYITDSAASGTALACGSKTRNGAIGVDTLGNELESILKVAERNGMATGLVATAAITHATPAAFIANEKSRNDYEAIAADFLKTDIDVFIGGGLDHFSKRQDGTDLTAQLREQGYTVTTGADAYLSHSEGKLAAFVAPVHPPRYIDGRGEMLTQATEKAIELLSQDEDGFFLMVEGSQIDWGGHANDQDYVISETLDFMRAVEKALDFAEQDGETLVVITADHETGGMVVLDASAEEVKTVFTTGGHTGIMIPVYAMGPGASQFTGLFDNTGFKERFLSALGIAETGQ